MFATTDGPTIRALLAGQTVIADTTQITDTTPLATRTRSANLAGQMDIGDPPIAVKRTR